MPRLKARTVSPGPGKRPGVEAEDLSLDGPDRHRRHPVDLGGPGAVREDDAAGDQGRPVGERDARDPVVRALDPVHEAGHLAHADVGRGGRQRVQQHPVVTAPVGRHQEPAADGRGEQRLEGAALAADQALVLEALPVEVFGERPQPRGVVGVGGDRQRRPHPQPGGQARGLHDLGGEGRPAAARRLVEGEQRAFRERRLGDRGEHPGGDAGGRSGTFADHEGHVQAGLRQPPGRRGPDESAAHHHDVGGAHVRVPSIGAV